MVRLWVPLGLALSIALAGCVIPVDQVSSAATLDASPAGLVRVVENADPDRTRLVGFELDLHADDWQEHQSYGFESDLALAPFGDLTGWGVFVFDQGGKAVRLVTAMPSHGVIYPLGTPFQEEASMDTRVTGFFEDAPTTFRVVVALVGAGGVALGPSPEWDEPPTAEELLAMPTAVPAPIGTGTGLSVEAHMDFTNQGALGGQVTIGTPDISYGGPLPSQVPSPLIDLRVETAAPAGWSYVSGTFRAVGSQGVWDATVEADGTHEFGGLVLQHTSLLPPVYSAEGWAVGRPIFHGSGATDSPVTAGFAVSAAGVDHGESYYMEHIAFATPLGQLIGVDGPDFDAAALQGLLGDMVGDPPAPRYAAPDGALVTPVGDFESVMVGAVPPHLQDALDGMDA